MKYLGEEKYTRIAEGCLSEEIQSQIQAKSKDSNNKSLPTFCIILSSSEVSARMKVSALCLQILQIIIPPSSLFCVYALLKRSHVGSPILPLAICVQVAKGILRLIFNLSPA